MKALDRLMVDMLLKGKEAPPPKKKGSQELTVKQFLKIMKNMPTFKKEFEEALKALEPPEKNKDKLSLSQRFMLWVLAGVFFPPLYLLFMHKVFTAVGW